MGSQVVTGATLPCSMGTTPSTFAAAGAAVSATTAAGVITDTGPRQRPALRPVPVASQSAGRRGYHGGVWHSDPATVSAGPDPVDAGGGPGLLRCRRGAGTRRRVAVLLCLGWGDHGDRRWADVARHSDGTGLSWV